MTDRYFQHWAHDKDSDMTHDKDSDLTHLERVEGLDHIGAIKAVHAVCAYCPRLLAAVNKVRE